MLGAVQRSLLVSFSVRAAVFSLVVLVALLCKIYDQFSTGTWLAAAYLLDVCICPADRPILCLPSCVVPSSAVVRCVVHDRTALLHHLLLSFCFVTRVFHAIS